MDILSILRELNMPYIGFTAQALAFILAIYSAVVAIVAHVKASSDASVRLLGSAKNSALGATALLTVAVIVLEYLLITGHYQTAYVSGVSNNSASLFFKIVSMWGGQNGSLLFFAWIMSLFTGSIFLWRWDDVKHLLPYAIATMQAILAFFIGLTVFFANTFEQLPFAPMDGGGLNPLLYHWGMVIHPPILYIGFTGFVIPFSFAISALIMHQKGDAWMRITRRWTLFAWIFLGAGLLLGGRWAYDVLGWGGYWGWDPVENAAFIPWLVATPFIHSVIMQENRGMMKRWNIGMIMVTFILVIEGVFITRSGVIGSVHAFAQSAIGPYFLVGIVVISAFALFLFVSRWEDLSSENELDGLLSRESAFLLNNLLFVSIAFTVWWGSHFPIISEAFTGEKIVVGPPFFEQVTGPLFAILVFLMGIAPLMPWRHVTIRKLMQLIKIPLIVGILTIIALYSLTWIKTIWAVLALGFCAFSITAILIEYWRGISARRRAHKENFFMALTTLVMKNQRRYGGYLIHLGMLFSVIGIIGMEFYQVETQQNVAVGESMTISSPFVGTYRLTYLGLSSEAGADSNVEIIKGTLEIEHNGKVVGEIHPYQEFFIRQQQPMTIPGVHGYLSTELYVIIAGWENNGQSATFKAYINPLVNWLWFGGIVFILGTIVAGLPINRRSR
ncbi:MAG: hypothetical protein B6242_05625 [Anaerolineaceae bacterium 4572_78]|nr:MAG: hypothetical protein B6242_05625 [Anaerolineaceae bacterium 4572_78]